MFSATVRYGSRLNSWNTTRIPARDGGQGASRGVGLPLEQDAALFRREETAKELDQRRLAGAVWPTGHGPLPGGWPGRFGRARAPGEPLGGPLEFDDVRRRGVAECAQLFSPLGAVEASACGRLRHTAATRDRHGDELHWILDPALSLSPSCAEPGLDAVAAISGPNWSMVASTLPSFTSFCTAGMLRPDHQHLAERPAASRALTTPSAIESLAA